MMFVKKTDGKLRRCIDYRELNKITNKDTHPLPLIKKVLDRVGRARYFTKLDIKDAYHNILIKKEDEWKKTFSTILEIDEYLFMPFEVCNALAAFQPWINKVHMEYIAMCCIVYLNDVLMLSKTLRQHGRDINKILEAIQKSGRKMKFSKC